MTRGISRELLEPGKADVWDSGKVASSQSTHVEYGGVALQSNADYYWSVQVWDEAGRPNGFCDPECFGTALLDEHDWQAPWYGSPRALVQLALEYDDGTVEHVVSNASWQGAWSPITFNCIYDGEDYDARLEQPGWDAPGGETDAWRPVNVVQGPGGRSRCAMQNCSTRTG